MDRFEFNFPHIYIHRITRLISKKHPTKKKVKQTLFSWPEDRSREIDILSWNQRTREDVTDKAKEDEEEEELSPSRVVGSCVKTQESAHTLTNQNLGKNT